MSRWFRHYAGMVRDAKLVAAALKSRQPIERVVWVWAAILESAAEIDDNGRFELDTAEVAYFLRSDEADVVSVLAALEAGGRVVEGRVAKWGDRQYQSDRSAERQRRYRDRQKEHHGGDRERHDREGCRNADDEVTSLSRHGDAPETEADTETETEGAKNNNNPPSTSEGGAVEPVASQGQGDEPEPAPEEIPATLDRRPYPEAFEALWQVYRPIAAKNATKADACSAWRILSEPDKAACLDGLRLYVAWMGEEAQRRAGTKAKHLATFIERRGWEPFTEAQPSAKSATLWVANDDARWPALAERWRTERGKPPPATASQGHIGQGWYFPAEWQAH